MKRKKTKKALSGSVLALVLCFVMLIGTTFAWFTSSDSTAVNTIQAGELKVDIVDATTETSLENSTLEFKDANDKTENLFWEPGVTFRTQGFKIKNTGSLALKYNFSLNGVNGDSELLEAIEFSVVYGDDETEAPLTSFEDHLSANGVSNNTYYIQGHMKEEAGNRYQGKTLTGIGIMVYATQYAEEYDSSTNQYDKDAGLPTAVYTAAELRTALESGGNYVLMNDLDMTNVDWPALTVSSALTLDGNNKTISNLKVRHYNDTGSNGVQYGFGFISNAKGNVTIKNLTFSAADVGPEQTQIDAGKGNIGGVVMGYSYATTVLDNVTVTSSTVSGYGKLGCLIGYATGNSDVTLTNCASTSNTIKGGSNMGGLIGTVDSKKDVKVNNCTVSSITFTHVRGTETLLTLDSDVTVVTEGADKGYSNFTLKAGSTFNKNANGYHYSYSANYYTVITGNWGKATINGTEYGFCEEVAVNS